MDFLGLHNFFWHATVIRAMAWCLAARINWTGVYMSLSVNRKQFSAKRATYYQANVYEKYTYQRKPIFQ